MRLEDMLQPPQLSKKFPKRTYAQKGDQNLRKQKL
jgi:hypothetical protein